MVLLLAVFPVIPMPIAGGTPILIVVVTLILAWALIFNTSRTLDRYDVRFIVVALVLLALENISAVIHGETGDILYFLGRGFWLITAIAIILALSPSVRLSRTERIAAVLVYGLVLLLCAMLVESLFYPKWQVGRQIGLINIPFPRATGVPNSDGKLGTFLVICLTFFLFLRPRLPRWQHLVLQFGPWIGLAFTQSRSTLMALAVAYGVFWISRTFTERRPLAAVFRLCGMITALMAILAAGTIAISALIGEGIYRQNFLSRFHHYEYGAETIAKAPLVGAGASAIREEDDRAGIHNTPIAMSVKSGVIAGGLVFILMTAPVSLIHRRRLLGFRLAMAAGITTEHMLYPGFINEFLIFAYVIAKLAVANIDPTTVSNARLETPLETRA